MKNFEEYRNFYQGGGGGGEGVNEPLFPPKTRKQFYEALIAGFDVELPNDMTKLAPKTNKEKYLAKKAGLYDGELPTPKTAEEYYLYTIAAAESDVDLDEHQHQ